MKFYFAEWAQLAKQNKVSFENKRVAFIKQVMESWASNDNLRWHNGLQFQINMTRGN
jgi:hypothetical protein